MFLMDDKEFYDKAFSYFTYHAEQRTTMINFFIAVFGACVALYGSLILQSPIACILISIFLFIVSIIFYFIDVRNKLDVKQSQSVLCAFEEKYNVTSSKEHAAYGVFSNEENVFLVYDKNFRKTDPDYVRIKRNLKKYSQSELDLEIKRFVEKHPTLNPNEVKSSLYQSAIPHLSSCIKLLYFICIGVSIVGLTAATILCFI